MNTHVPLQGRALVLGKFLPPHRGHQFLIDMAASMVEEVFCVVGSLQREPIPGVQRVQWLEELYAHTNVTIIHLDRELPQYPEEHPDFWDLWRDSLLEYMGCSPDYVVASEPYGTPLAKVLDAVFLPQNVSRSVFPVSGTAVRDRPFAHWDLLTVPVQRHYRKHIAVVGPESCGKSTLASMLATHVEAQLIPEYAREWIEQRGSDMTTDTIAHIARGQRSLQSTLEDAAGPLLIHDTELFSTVLWSNLFFGSCPDWIEKLATEQQFDHYLLLKDDVPFVPDDVRYFPEQRRNFFKAFKSYLDERSHPYTVIEGNWEERDQTARACVASILGDTNAE